MKTKYMIISIIVLAAIVAILTNPNPERHKEVVKNKFYQYLQKPLMEDVTNAKTRREEAVRSIEMLLGSTLIDRIIDNLVSSENYLLFSITNISFEGKSKTIGYGVFGNVYLAKELDEAMNETLNKTMSEDLRKNK